VTVRAEVIGPTDVATVLRAFDGLRRRLARSYVGGDGISIGYDRLDIDHQLFAGLDDTCSVEVTATVVGSRRRAHEVEYVARTSAGLSGAPLVLARGWTQTPEAPA
jgi:hypothetical protein